MMKGWAGSSGFKFDDVLVQGCCELRVTGLI
jgi:hypothetical protein